MKVGRIIKYFALINVDTVVVYELDENKVIASSNAENFREPAEYEIVNKGTDYVGFWLNGLYVPLCDLADA